MYRTLGKIEVKISTVLNGLAHNLENLTTRKFLYVSKCLTKNMISLKNLSTKNFIMKDPRKFLPQKFSVPS